MGPFDEPCQDSNMKDTSDIPVLPKVLHYRAERDRNSRLLKREFVDEIRQYVFNNEQDRLREVQNRERFIGTISKLRENCVRNWRNEQSRALFNSRPFYSYAIYHQYYHETIVEESEEEREDEEESEDEEGYFRLDISEEDEEEELPVPSLPPEYIQVIEDCFRKRHDELIVEENGIEVRVRDLKTLKDTCWLNDEIINFYFQLIQKRSDNNLKYPKVYCFNTFFVKRLREGGHKAVKRWTKKVDLFSHDLILIPVHLENHWVLATVCMKNFMINYYDSMSGCKKEVLVALHKYLEDEMKDKKGEVLDTSKWASNVVKDIPQQKNGYDCGVFTCKYAERLSLNKPFDFTQVSS